MEEEPKKKYWLYIISISILLVLFGGLYWNYVNSEEEFNKKQQEEMEKKAEHEVETQEKLKAYKKEQDKKEEQLEILRNKEAKEKHDKEAKEIEERSKPIEQRNEINKYVFGKIDLLDFNVDDWKPCGVTVAGFQTYCKEMELGFFEIVKIPEAKINRFRYLPQSVDTFFKLYVSLCKVFGFSYYGNEHPEYEQFLYKWRWGIFIITLTYHNQATELIFTERTSIIYK